MMDVVCSVQLVQRCYLSQLDLLPYLSPHRQRAGQVFGISVCYCYSVSDISCAVCVLGYKTARSCGYTRTCDLGHPAAVR